MYTATPVLTAISNTLPAIQLKDDSDWPPILGLTLPSNIGINRDHPRDSVMEIMR